MDILRPRLYLASRSPRRRELLTQIGVQFDTILFRNHPRELSEVDETPHAGESPLSYVERVTRAKAELGSRIATLRKLQSQPVLAADTTIDVDGEILGKPLDASDAKTILRRLSGRSHRVLTCVAVAFEGCVETRQSVSEVRFTVLDDARIDSYVATGEPLDKAGAYGIQGHAGAHVRHISGSYSGIMGLPLYETAELLRTAGFAL